MGKQHMAAGKIGNGRMPDSGSSRLRNKGALLLFAS